MSWWNEPINTEPAEINWPELIKRMEEEATKPPSTPEYIVSKAQYDWMVRKGYIKVPPRS